MADLGSILIRGGATPSLVYLFADYRPDFVYLDHFTLLTHTPKTSTGVNMGFADTSYHISPFDSAAPMLDRARSIAGQISITTKVNDVIVGGIVCTLFHKTSAQRVTSLKSDENGLVVFTGLSLDPREVYYIIAFTDFDYNALIFDKLLAI
ncbi:MAG: hypothetical protein COA83_09755 [Methylophaga sp.]|nr:MAG: hypothetical protein COA83_09755 [Methylophaga sp.]